MMRSSGLDSAERTKTISGRVAADGSISYNGGFTVARQSAGVYLIRFSNNIRYIKSAVAVIMGNSFAQVNYTSQNSITVYAYSSFTVNGDAAFHFQAEVVI